MSICRPIRRVNPAEGNHRLSALMTVLALAALFLLVFDARLVSAQPVHVQSTKNGGTAVGSLAVSFGALPAVDRLIVVAASTWDPTAGEGDLPAGTVTDNQGNIYTRATIAVATGGTVRIAIFYAIVTTSAGTFTVTVNPSGAGADMDVAIHEYSGNVTLGVLDVAVSAIGTSTTPNSGPITTTAPLTLIFGAMTEVADNTMAPGAAFTQRQEEESNTNFQCLNTEDKTAGVVGTHSADWTLSASGAWAGAVAAFKFHQPSPGGFGGRSFVKSTALGNQTVAHGLGEIPKAIIFWVSSDTAGLPFTNFYTSIGFTDGTSAGSFSAAAAALNNQGFSNASRRMANKAITIVLWSENLIAEADLASWDATNFTLNWTTNDATLARIHFVAIGGTDVSAQVVNWQAPAVTGDQAVPGVGFEPDVVLHAYSGSGFTASPIPGTSIASAHIGLGAMTKAGDQWANMIRTIDNITTTESNRGQQTDAAIYMFGAGVSVLKEASFVSMDPDGFTVNFSVTDGAPSQIISLALKGVSARAGNFTKVTAGVPQTVADVGFRPEVVLLTSIQDIARAAPVVHARYGIGASDGTVEGSTAYQDTNALGTSSNDQYDKGDKVFIKVDNNTPTVNAEADLTGFFNGGFNLNWTTNDAVATQILYLALGPKTEAQVLSGSYTGDGTDDRAINVGFVPDFVILKSAGATTGVFRSSTMIGDNAKPAVGSTALTPNLIQSIDTANAGGFTVGDDGSVNTNGTMYYWVAFKAGPGKMSVGTYTGTGTGAPPPVTGLGFSPELVYVMSAGADYAVHRSAALANTLDFEFSFGDPTWINSLDGDGFTIGSTDAKVNQSGVVYHYVAWNEVAGYMDVGSYVGNGLDNRDQPTGFAPEYVTVMRAGSDAVHRPASLDQGVDSTLYFRAVASGTLRIKALLTDGFRRGTTGNVNASGLTYAFYAWKRSSQPMILSGDYTGDGAATQQLANFGFAPDVVIVKTSLQIAAIRTSTMPVDTTKSMTGATAITAAANTQMIRTLDSDGFTVGNDAAVNANTIAYYFIAFKAAPGTMKVGTYTGTSAANAITGVGFSPELVFIMREGASEAMHRSSASAEAYNFANSAGDATLLTSLDADGFTVDTNDLKVNRIGNTYHYIAWNEIPGEMDIGSYGAGAARDITGVGFEPEYVIVKQTNGRSAVHHPASVGRSTDSTFYFNATASSLDMIEALVPDGFRIGFDFQVNEPSTTYVYYAWKRPSVTLTAVRLISFDAARQPSGRTLVRWRTGWEVDNLGFNVYREQDGRKTRLTPSLIAGSGLALGPGNASNTARSYAWWDNGPSGPGVTYWLQDVNLNGKSTWHGPIAPAAGDGVEAAAVDSPLLRELARRRDGGSDRTSGSRAGVPDASDTLWPQAAADASREWNDGRLQGLRLAGAMALVSPAVARQQELAAGPAVKIGVRSAGWYRVGQPELVAAGLNPAVDPRTLQLYLEGIEVAAIVRGEADGRFDAGDALEFYGAGVDTPYTDTRIYWLHAGTQSGVRAAFLDRSTSPTAAPASFPFTVERSDRTIFFAALQNGEADNFFGELVVAGEETPQVLATPHVDPAAAAAASLEVTLQGVTDAPGDSDHRVAVRLNGTELGEIVFEGRTQGVGTFSVSHAALLDGENTVTLEARGGEADTSLVERVRLTYQHTFDADQGALAFTADAEAVVTVRGLDVGAVRAFDLSDPRAPIELRGFETTEGGLQAVTLRVPGSGARRLLALSDARLMTPLSVRANQPSDWHRGGQDGTHVIIAHRDFLASLVPLKELREGQGHAGALIDVEDLYDEFSFGQKTPHALKDFLIAAKSAWRRAPQFVVLAGNATSDPRDYYGLGEPDFVPTKIVPTASLETASDDWFADVDGDSLAELAAVGRLPVRTAAEAAAVVAKIVDYERSGDAPWNRHVLMLADQNEPGSNFEASSMEIAGRLPSDYTATHIFRGNSASNARAQLLQRINEGQVFVNFVGHGSVDVWGKYADLLTPSDITSSWANQSRLPFVVAMNCLNGFFHGLFPEESLAEALVRAPDRGAIAVWASSSMTEPAAQVRMNRELIALLFDGRARTIGEAAIAAKAMVADVDVRRSWILFGDPAMGLKGRPVDALTVPAMSLDRVALAFGATNTGGTLTNKTTGQPLTVTFTGVSGAAWTATADQPWVHITGGAGTGAGQFTVNVVSSSGLPASGIVSATLTVASAAAVNSPRTVSISLSLFGNAPTRVPFGFFDSPVTGSTGVTGSIAVSGWALDDVGISGVRVYRNCLAGIDAPANCQNLAGHNVAVIGDAAFVAGARPDVEAAFPEYPANYRGGWGLLVLTNMLPHVVNRSAAGGGQGPVTLYAFATDVEGYRVLLGTKTITLDNDNASTPFGAIDTPGQGGTVSGVAVNFGWALTPGTAMIPTDGSTMHVVVDGVAVGTVNYNYCRGTGGSTPAAGQCDDDVAQLFGGATNITNASGAQGYFLLDTTTLANGRHTIAWGVSDDLGRPAGIGSRFFTVLNDAPSSVVASARAAATLSDAPARVIGASAALAWRSTAVDGVSARVGFDFSAPFEDIAPDDAGLHHVTIPELGRLELHLGGSVERGYLQANGTLRALPPGSRLDADGGVFTWAPGPAYVGVYDLVFLQGAAQIRVQVTLETKTAPGVLVRAHIDLPATGRAVSGIFTVAGWALDARAWQGSGVGAVHVWAHRRDVPASAAVFLGAAALAGLRPDVAAVFGPQFNRTGWSLTASGLAPGTYDVTAFFWSNRTARFEDARTVSVTVR